MPSNNALQTDKGEQSCLLHSQKPRQPAFAAELGRYAAPPWIASQIEMRKAHVIAPRIGPRWSHTSRKG